MTHTARRRAGLLWRFKRKCPLCGEPVLKAIFAGLPLKMCSNDDCQCAWGLGTVAMNLMSNGAGWALFIYPGSYWVALYHWLSGDKADDYG